MEGLIMAAQLLLSLSILIVVHEGGHFVAARVFKIKVEKFYLFFDFLFPMANVLNFSLFKFKKGDTEYGIGWFPLGGYVKIAGMVDESMDKDQMKAPPEPWEFRSKPAWQRLIVMLGGIIVNVCVGVLIFIGMTYILGDTYVKKDYVNANGGIESLELGQKLGLKTGDKIIRISGKDFEDFMDVMKPDALLSRDSYYTVVRDGQELDIAIPGNFIENFSSKDAASKFIIPRRASVIGHIAEKVKVKNVSGDTTEQESIAKRVGLQLDDQVVEIDGHPVAYQDEVFKLVRSGPRDSISFKVKRGNEILSFKQSFAGQEMIGFSAKLFDERNLTHISYGLGASIGLGTYRAFDIIVVQLKAFRKFFTREISIAKSVSGPIRMAQAFSPEWDWRVFWKMTGLLSMVLAFMNLLPIPALDGGYVVFLLYEMVSGREPSEKFFENSLKVGMALLLLLMVFVFYNDISKLITGQ